MTPKPLTLAALATCLLTFPAAADTPACATIENDLDRLACYDKESGRTPKIQVKDPTPDTGDWQVRTQKSEFQDTTDVFISVSSESPVTCRSFGSAQTMRLMIRCLDDTTAIFISGACHMADHNGYDRVDYRLDDNPTKTARLLASTDSRALGRWSGSTAIPLAKQLIGHERLILRFTPFSMSPVTARFDISGIDEAIKPLRASCGW